MNELLFSYGTLREERVQLKLFGRTLVGAEDQLKGYSITTIKISDEKFLSSGEQKNQSTLVYTGLNEDMISGMALYLTPEELKQTDNYEPDNYKREIVILESGKKAWVYIAT